MFKIKLDAFLEDLLGNSRKKGIFGKVIGYTWVIEFQKRGLPHAHILLILDHDDKPRSPADFDSIVSAEIPDPVAHPLAYETVMQSMVHGPCGEDNPRSPCMKDGKCSKKFPMAYQEETAVNNNGYPKYRRREGRTAIIERGQGRQRVVDNRWIVPHNLFLSTKYNAHINVEICTSVTAVKYLYKYVYKGVDRARMGLAPVTNNNEGTQGQQQQQKPINEPKQFVDARYLSTCECLWRIFKFPLHGHGPSVLRLQIHEPDMHPVYHEPGANAQEALAAARDSMLMGWFKLNERDPDARQYTYPEIATHYLWNKRERRWRLRARPNDAIPRMYFVHPRQGERYCLRLLLLHVRGATSWLDLRTVPGHVAPFATFRGAAVARGLLTDGQEWFNCLSEARGYQMPFAMRDLFATILCHGMPADQRALWDAFSQDLCEDFLHRFYTLNGGEEQDHRARAER